MRIYSYSMQKRLIVVGEGGVKRQFYISRLEHVIKKLIHVYGTKVLFYLPMLYRQLWGEVDDLLTFSISQTVSSETTYAVVGSLNESLFFAYYSYGEGGITDNVYKVISVVNENASQIIQEIVKLEPFYPIHLEFFDNGYYFDMEIRTFDTDRRIGYYGLDDILKLLRYLVPLLVKYPNLIYLSWKRWRNMLSEIDKLTEKKIRRYVSSADFEEFSRNFWDVRYRHSRPCYYETLEHILLTAGRYALLINKNGEDVYLTSTDGKTARLCYHFLNEGDEAVQKIKKWKSLLAFSKGDFKFIGNTLRYDFKVYADKVQKYIGLAKLVWGGGKE